MNRLWLTIEEKFKFRPAKDFFWTVVFDEAYRNSFHPVREYLDELRWDGMTRIDSWLIDYANAEDTDYVRAVGALLLVAAVRRIRSPGCKFDEMPVLQSVQGFDKSTALSILAVKPEWFSDDLPLCLTGSLHFPHLQLILATSSQAKGATRLSGALIQGDSPLALSLRGLRIRP